MRNVFLGEFIERQSCEKPAVQKVGLKADLILRSRFRVQRLASGGYGEGIRTAERFYVAAVQMSPLGALAVGR